MKVILISGKAEAGKTTTAEILKNELWAHRVAIVPYGAYVKSTAKLLFGWDGKKDEKGRELLQHWGTDVVRAKFPDFWVSTVLRLAVVAQDELDYLIVDDCRFPNEIEEWHFMPFKTLSIRVERPGHINMLTEDQKMHISETALDDYTFDVTISACDLDGLKASVKNTLLPMVVA